MKARLFTTLPEGSSSATKHYSGLPPELADGKDARREVPTAAFLVIEEKPDGVFLYRFSAIGECVSDTWHKSIDDAKHQAAYEYGGTVLSWEDVPQVVLDVAEYGLARTRA
jgi:hypothetical protein